MGGLGVKVQHFPLTLLVVLTTLTLPCERDMGAIDLCGRSGTCVKYDSFCSFRFACTSPLLTDFYDQYSNVRVFMQGSGFWGLR